MVSGPDIYARFDRHWAHLTHPHVRALAGLLETPDMLDAASPAWQRRVATLPPVSEEDVTFLTALDADPTPLLDVLGAAVPRRLGLYAERLLVFWLRHTGRLVAHNLQVRDGPHKTIGEFDLLLDDGKGGLVHWEMATKFYLLAAGAGTDAFVGPNLADTLGAKLTKIMSQQLQLSGHPAAHAVLPGKVSAAQTFVRGWLFYEDMAAVLPPALGISANHCRGFWCEAGQLPEEDVRYLVLDRHDWLAPAVASEGMDRMQLRQVVSSIHARTDAPVMVAVCAVTGTGVKEIRRGFIVPDGWKDRAATSVRHGIY